jgi:hypothetical protein
MLLFSALGDLGDEGQHDQKTKKFWIKFFKILMVKISTSKPSIKKYLHGMKRWCSS